MKIKIRKLSIREQEILERLQVNSVKSVIKSISRMGGIPYLVGGAVRDLLLGLPVKDLDFEVYNLTIVELKNILGKVGSVSSVGKSFGVLKFDASDCCGIDWSLPRKDSVGRHPKVSIDPKLTIEQALERRDLTINAMAINLVGNELYDPFGGEEDLARGILHCPNINTFPEDPLRLYRVMQFLSRFEFTVSEALGGLCATMDISAVSRERIAEEVKKLLLQSDAPSLGFRWLKKIGRLQEIFPELAALDSVPQNKVYHPEGDVLEHTMQVVDAAAQIRERLDSEENKLILMYAALCHDLGKAATTVQCDRGKLTSYNHEVVGVERSNKFLKRICENKKLISSVKKLVRYHMSPGQLLQCHAKITAYKRLAVKLAPETNGKMLALLFEADRRGRNGKGSVPLLGPIADVETFLDKMGEAEVVTKPEEPVLKGRDLLRIVPAGLELGILIKRAYEIQLEQGVRDKELLIKRVMEERS